MGGYMRSKGKVKGQSIATFKNKLSWPHLEQQNQSFLMLSVVLDDIVNILEL